MSVFFAVSFFVICLNLVNGDILQFALVNNFSHRHDCRPYISTTMMSIAYFTPDPYNFGQILNVSVNRLNLNHSSTDFLNTSRTLMMYSCSCSDFKLNTIEFFVSPFMISLHRSIDALIMCMLHSATADISSILNVPLPNLEFYMMAKYSILMPRNLFADNKTKTSICSDKYGNSLKTVPGQVVCFSLNHVKRELDSNKVVDQLSYHGPHLSSQFPTLPVLLLKNSISQSSDFEFLWLTCSTLHKTMKSLRRNYQSTCRTEYADNTDYRSYSIICCCYEDMDYCDYLSKNVHPSAILCINHIYEGRSIIEYARRCWVTIVNKYIGDFSSNVGNLLPVLLPSITIADDISSIEGFSCNQHKMLTVRTIRYCSDSNFCNVFDGKFVESWKKCKYSRDIKLHEEFGCILVVYKDMEKWTLTTPIWFNWTESIMVPLEPSQAFYHENSTYNVYKAYLSSSIYLRKCLNVSLNYEFFVIACNADLCDKSIFATFEKQANKTYLDELTQQADVPHCNSGFMIYPMNKNGSLTVPSIVNITRVVGKYCIVKLRKIVTNKSFVRITYRSKFDKPNKCESRITEKSKTEYFCCYESFDRTEEAWECNNDTLIVEAMKKKTNIDNFNQNFDASSIYGFGNKKSNVYQGFDDCDQRKVGKNSKKCAPGGFGCFHLLKIEAEKKDTIATCTGFAEERIANDANFYNDLGVALLCLVPESIDKCQYVYKNGIISLLCCCQSQTTFKHVNQCVEDSKLMFHLINRAPLRVNAFMSNDIIQ